MKKILKIHIYGTIFNKLWFFHTLFFIILFIIRKKYMVPMCTWRTPAFIKIVAWWNQAIDFCDIQTFHFWVSIFWSVQIMILFIPSDVETLQNGRSRVGHYYFKEEKPTEKHNWIWNSSHWSRRSNSQVIIDQIKFWVWIETNNWLK